MKTDEILIIGGGYVGQKLIHALISRGYEKIYVIDEYEHTLDSIRFQYPNIKCLLEDVINTSNVISFIRRHPRISTIVYTAAIKHIYMAQENINRAIEVNTLALDRLIDGLLNIHNGFPKTLIYLSTDKAPLPESAYGTTKLLSEYIMQQYAGSVDESKMRFLTLRYGNVMNAAGSVIPKFDLAARTRVLPLPITNPDMVRYMLPDQLATSMILELSGIITNGCTFHSDLKSGDIVVPAKVPTSRLIDLARSILYAYNINDSSGYKVIGARPGERVCETMITPSECRRLHKWREIEIKYPICITGDTSYTFSLWRISSLENTIDDKELKESGLLSGGVHLLMNTDETRTWLKEWGVV